MVLDGETLTVATRAWLEAMRQAWIKRYGVERGECPVPRWDDMPGDDRIILVRATKAAIQAADPINVAKVRARQITD